MKKYVAVWGALFFCVICISLYLMLETISTSPGRLPDGLNSILSNDISMETSFQDVSNDMSHDRIGQEWNEIFQTVEFVRFNDMSHDRIGQEQNKIFQTVELTKVTIFATEFDKKGALNGVEMKINEIQSDIERNRKTIDQIRDAVKTLSGGDKHSVDKLKEILNKQQDSLKVNSQRLKELQNADQQVPKPADKPAAVVVMDVEKDKPQAKAEVHYDEKSWKGNFASLRKEVSVGQDMCSWVDAPKSQAEIQMSAVMDQLPFDNPDGGAWKQGWNVSYRKDQWGPNKRLKVFVVPHSHNDPGWVKTFEDYYNHQTKHILNLMVEKLEKYPYGKFIYAEMSFFQMWWDDIESEKRERVKKLFAEGRLEIVTGGWVMNDEANTHYFAMIDQLLEGHQWLDGTLGVKPQSGWAIDPFGHTPTMAYLLRRSGFNGMLIQRVHYAIKKYLAKTQNLEFMWRQVWDGDQNTDMLCHMMPFYSYDVPHTCGPEPAICCQFDFRRLPGSSYNCPWRIPPQRIHDGNVAERTKLLIDQWKKKSTLYRSNSLFIPLGDDFRYDKAEEWDEQFTNYFKIFEYLKAHPELGVEAQFGTLTDYFNSIHEEYGTSPGHKPTNYPTLSGDFFTYADKDDHYWSGYFTSRPFQKNLDRTMESNLRAAEILFTLATASARRDDNKNFPMNNFMEKLINARRNLGLFQHHDGITGTAKDFVVVDYGKRLLGSLRDTKVIMKECATFLTLDSKTEYALSENTPLYSVDETRSTHDSLPEKTILELSGENPSPVLFYNPLAQSRDQVVKVYVNALSVEVRDQNDNVVISQVEPYWSKESEISSSTYKVSFRVAVPALGIVRYTIKKAGSQGNGKNIPASILIFNSGDDSPIKSPHFSIQKLPGSDITLENPYMKATFSGASGMLQSVMTKDDGVQHIVKTEFVTYGTKPHSKERSGAYLFLPDGPAKLLSDGPPPVHIIQGPVVSEVHVYYKLVEHVIRLYNSSGIDGISLDMQNIVDLRSQSNMEMAVRITSDIKNKEFYTDLNGFQMQKHKTYDKLTLQGNFYPMPTMGFVEDEKKRLSILSANSLGFANLKSGMIEVMLDRRLNQDDSRGLGQGVLDSKRTPSRFKLLLEKRQKGSFTTEKVTAFPSLLAHQTSLHLIHPVYVFPKHSGAVTLPKQSTFQPMRGDLPCDLHLLNLRTMQNRDDGPERTVPRHTAAMFMHRLGTDCSYPNRGLTCNSADGKVILSEMFSEYEFPAVQQVSLTLMYTEEDIDPTAQLDLDPMEIGSYVATLQ